MPSVPYFKRFQAAISELANDALFTTFDVSSCAYRFFFVSRSDLVDTLRRLEVRCFGGVFAFDYLLLSSENDLFLSDAYPDSIFIVVPLRPNLKAFLGRDSLVNDFRRKKR